MVNIFRSAAEQTQGRLNSMVRPLTDQLQAFDWPADISEAELRERIERVKEVARAAGLRGVRYGLVAALAAVSPKDAINRLIGYVEEAERENAIDQGVEETQVEIYDHA